MNNPLQFLLLGGRRIAVSQLHILTTSTDWSDPKKPKRMDDRLPELVANFFGDKDLPILIKPPQSNFPPPVTCIGSFESDSLEKLDVTVQYSFLIICWFTDGADKAVRNLVCEGLADVEWELHARDYHSEW